MTLNEVLKNTNYDVSLFSEEARKYVEDAIVVKTIRGKESLFIKCLKRDKEIALKPEEAVRQLYLYKLIHEYGYPTSRIEVEFPIHFGREVKRADIAIMDKDRLMVPYIIVELKKPKLTDGKEQLKSYCNATGAPIGVWTNGEQISYYNRKDPNYFEPITNIPKVSEKLSDIINEKFTYEDLKKIDRISQQKRSLRSLIQEMEDEVLASAGVDSFEEIFKLIFAKLYDELICERDSSAYLKFRNSGETDFELKEKIQSLFDDAKKKWEGIFTDESKILLSPSHLAVCVATLQDIKLFNNNLDVVDDAFEYLMSKAQKGEKGQYFTPRYVIDMCVKMMNPSVNDKIIDTACGSSGFTVHSIFKVWKDIRREKGLPEGEGFTAAQRIPEETNFVRDNVFAIDFDEKTVRVARTLNLIAGDGQTNVQFQCNISGILESSTEHVKENPTESEQDYLSWLLREINVALTHSIVEAFKLHYENNAYGKRLLVKIGNLEKRIISLIWQIFDLNAKDETFKTPDEMGRSRNTYELIQQRPLNYFQYHFDVNLTPQRDLSASEKEWFRKLHESRRQNSVLWFLDFVYRLRNALFHEIIDPLDEEWQVIFKNAYLVLKEIVDLNIAAIETR